MAHGDVAQPVEERDAVVGELDALDAAVALLAPAAHEPLALQRVEVVGERGAGDRPSPAAISDWRAPLLGADQQQHLPDAAPSRRPRPARGRTPG